MASTIITSIHSSLHDVELQLKAETFFYGKAETSKKLKYKLMSLKTFVLSARRLGNDGSLGFFLVRIEDIVRRKAEKIHPLCLDLNGDHLTQMKVWQSPVPLLSRMASEFQEHIKSLEEEIDKWYVTILDDLGQSGSLTMDEVLEIICSILESLVDFNCFRSTIPFNKIVEFEILGEEMEVLGEHLRFLKSLISFVTHRSVELEKDLLARTETIAINAASLLFMCRVQKINKRMCKEMQSKISHLLQMIKPTDSLVYEIYSQALCSAKLRGKLLAPSQNVDDNAFIAMKNFLESLISILWEMLPLNTYRGLSTKHQLQELYEGLRSLRTLLQQKPTNFDMKSKEDIGVVVCDTGVAILSLRQMNVVDLGLQDLLEEIRLILARIGEKGPEVPKFNFPRTNELGFVDLLLEKLMELTSCGVEPTVKNHVHIIQEELVFLRSFLVTIELHSQDDELHALWDRVLEVAYKVEGLIDDLVVGDLSDSFSASFDSIIKDIGNIKLDRLKIFVGDGPEIKVKKLSRTSSRMPSQRTPSIINEVVGFEGETKSLIERLQRGSKQLRIVVITGMAGIGKTTLATKIYNDSSILLHFYVRALSIISQVVDKKKVILDLSHQIDPKKSLNMTEQDLVENLWRSLKGRRYLIFLDDVWNMEAWNSLGGSFPDDNVGSRIILTSRLHDVAPHHMLDQEPYLLRELSSEESSELLQRKLFPESGWPPELRDMGMQIAKSCKGLPLTIVIVAGLLTTIEPEGWKEILDGLSSGIVSTTEQCTNSLELSYRHLPKYLRPCILYFGALPEDQEVSVRRLLRLWIAEGFVHKDEKKSREDIAEDYLKDLIGRSLIMPAKRRSDGGVKVCRIHDLLHDFCLQRAKDEYFFHFLKGCEELSTFNEPLNLRRLCIHSKPQHFKKSKLFCPRVRSLLFNSIDEQFLGDMSFMIHIFKLLRVLDLEQINIGSMFPNEIELLVQLVFLAIRGEMRHIPSSITKLSNLETLIVDAGDEMLSLPDNFWNLQKLKYLYIRSSYQNAGGCLPGQDLDSSPVLYELDRISGVIILSWGSNGEKLMRKFPKIRKLKCKLLLEDLGDIIIPDFLSQLESLHLSRYMSNFTPVEPQHGSRSPLYTSRLLLPKSISIFPFSRKLVLSLPTNLKKLTLSEVYLFWPDISSIGRLPNLEVLKLLHL